jgi:hypothetical protein
MCATNSNKAADSSWCCCFVLYQNQYAKVYKKCTTNSTKSSSCCCMSGSNSDDTRSVLVLVFHCVWLTRIDKMSMPGVDVPVILLTFTWHLYMAWRILQEVHNK